jgi:predicted site-specific integrase-resolvase
MAKFMTADLCRITGLHRNTIYNWLHKGIITPVEVISGVNIFSEETAEAIKKHYKFQLHNKLRKLGYDDINVDY